MPADPRVVLPDPREIDPRAVRRAYERAAATYDAAAVLHREVGTRMESRLDYIKIQPAAILDAGCGTGAAVAALAARYTGARIVALDFALPMVSAARARARGGRSLLRRLLPSSLAGAGSAPWFVCGDMSALPLRSGAFDLVWSNLALQWMNDLPRVIGEARRVLRVGGLFTFTTFGPDTLREIRAAFARADGNTHTNRFVDMHDVGDMLVEAGFADPVIDMETIMLTYPEPVALLHEMKMLGATNATRGRPRGLMGRARWQRMLSAVDAGRRDGQVPATFEVIYGHAWKSEPKRTAEGLPIINLRRPGRS